MTSRIARVWNGSAWEVITSTAAAPTAVVNYQSTAPSSPVTGQIWVNTSTNQFNVWNGSVWIAAITTYIYQSTAPANPIVGQVCINSTNNQLNVWNGSAWILTTQPGSNYQTSAPSSPSTGQIWIDSDDNNKLYVWSGSAWVTAGGGAPDEDQNILANRVFG
jgi:hypothetical protein